MVLEYCKTGAKGDKGDTGEQGVKGDTGEAGADGYIPESYCSMVLSAPQAIPQNQWEIVEFDTALYDNLNEFDIVNWRFVPVSDGYYHIDLAVSINGIAVNNYVILRLEINAYPYIYQNRKSDGHFIMQLLGSRDVRLLAGDIVSVVIHHDHPTARVIGAGYNDTYLTIHRFV